MLGGIWVWRCDAVEYDADLCLLPPNEAQAQGSMRYDATRGNIGVEWDTLGTSASRTTSCPCAASARRCGIGIAASNACGGRSEQSGRSSTTTSVGINAATAQGDVANRYANRRTVSASATAPQDGPSISAVFAGDGRGFGTFSTSWR